MIAVDANGADKGPGAVAEGVGRSGLPVLLFGPEPEIRGPAGPRARSWTLRRPSRRGRRRWPPFAPSPTPRSSRPPGPWARGARTRSSPPARPARRSRPPRSRSSACEACSARRSRCCCRCPGGPVLLLDAGASVEVRPEHLVQFAYMGACFMEAVVGVERPTVGLLSVGEESGKGTPGVLAAHERLAEGEPQLRRQPRGLRPCRRPAPTWWWPTGSPATSRSRCSRAPLRGVSREIRDADRAPARSRRLGGLLIRGKLRAAARRSRPRARRRRDPARACASRWWSAHGSFGPRGIEHAVRLAPRAVDEDMVGPDLGGARSGGRLAVRARW